MENLTVSITRCVADAFARAGYDASYGKVTVSNRPDLCEFQCNGALAAAKRYHTAPMVIAEAVAAKLDPSDFEEIDVAKPGFLNLRVSGTRLQEFLEQMRVSPRLGVAASGTGKTVVVDYGGPNIAKPLHIGHLRSAIIGESIKRIYQFFGYHAIGDVHLGDWGLPMGLIIASIAEQQPELPYFDPDHTGAYPAEPPFTLAELEQIYPAASARKKVDPEFDKRAHQATFELQSGRRGYRALWQHIFDLSLADIRRIYDGLDVHFESWLGERDADPYIPDMIADFQARGCAVQSEGALVFPVAEESDKKEMPPCILIKSDGAVLYDTTELATIVQRMTDFHPDKLLYLADARQSLHFEQVFRAARKSGIVQPETELEFLGFGTMNGADGKPFKTRDGGVMRLDTLISDITAFVRKKVIENQIVPPEDVEETTHRIAMAALKYGDLSNQPTKDYIFDIARFAAFEGNTGPYILYTIVRIKSILEKYGAWENLPIRAPESALEKDLMLTLTRLSQALEGALRTSSPNLICAYIYELAGCVNKFYHETRILSEADAEKRAGYIALIGLAKTALETCIHLLGFSAPDKM